MDRDFEADNIGGFVSISLSDCKTIGHYADKQTSRYTKTQLEDMKESFKTKKTGGMTELPEGMTRMQPSTNNKEVYRRYNKNRNDLYYDWFSRLYGRWKSLLGYDF